MSISRNGYLSRNEMIENAQEIVTYFVRRGWSLNAICGMLGNMEHESTINPGIFENLDYMNMVNGVGLVQWTPASGLYSFAQSQGISSQWLTLDFQCSRIQYELENNLQYYNPRRSFKDFSQSTESPYDLAIDFLTYYERPLNPNQPWRGESAEQWFDFFKGEGVDYETQPKPFMTHYPFSTCYPITSGYGFRTSVWPFWHLALDFGAPQGEEIKAMHGGIVTVPPYDANGYGQWVIVEGGNFKTVYAHMSKISVTSGQRIDGGQVIGLVGTTGNSTGPHLHLELWVNGSHANPEDYLDIPNCKGKEIQGLSDGQEQYVIYKPVLDDDIMDIIEHYQYYLNLNRLDAMASGDHHAIARELY